MYTHEDLARLQAQSLKMQGWIRRQTFSPSNEKTLRRFSSWEVAELIFTSTSPPFAASWPPIRTFPSGKSKRTAASAGSALTR